MCMWSEGARWVCDNQQLFQILCFFDLAQGSSLEGRRNGHTRGNSSPGITTQTEGKWKSFVLTLGDPSCISKFLLPPILPLQLFNEIGVREISASSLPLWCAIESLEAFFRTVENFEYSWALLYETLPRSYSWLLMCNVDRGPMKQDNWQEYMSAKHTYIPLCQNRCLVAANYNPACPRCCFTVLR